ncbi:MAG TPA: phosphate ABC transporter substrate-binding/OmpA family protein [Phycisphaerales bacterium]|nr:phosphate ABC transporter substrate-binding/OmpA family protein [Phycisphaerales bacterium]
MSNRREFDQQGPSIKPLGILLSLIMVGALVGLGAWMLMGRGGSPASPGSARNSETASAPAGGVQGREGEQQPAGEAAELALVTPEQVPTLPPPAAYVPKDNVVEIELSEYAGYAGLIVANGGLNPSDESIFAKKHGFKVKITLSEEEAWNRLQTGQLAASATTADVLAVFGRQFNVVVPVQIGYSRGADAIVVDSSIRRINDLKGKTLSTIQFTEAEFFIRFLAQESGTPVNVRDDLSVPARADAINLVFAEDGEQAGEVFSKDLGSGGGRIAGAVTWEPTPSEIAKESGGKARLLASNKNLLIIADVLVLNRGFAEENPRMAAGLVEGLLEGNRMIRDESQQHSAVVMKAFGWDAAKTQQELAKVHFSNLPENLAFFSGAIDMAGSFGGIYQSSVLAYGPQIIRNPVGPERFVDVSHLEAIKTSGAFADQKISIAPVRTEGKSQLESDPLLSRDIRFLFEPNSAKLDMSVQTNLEDLERIVKLLKVSPGSFVLLRGHVDNAKIEEFRQQGGETLVRKKALEAMELSNRRAAEIKRILIEQHKIDQARIETVGRGWEEPLGGASDSNRRVEVQWHTLE